MKLLREGADPDGFFDRLRTAGRGFLLLDYDGTLAPFQEDRFTAGPYPGVRERLAAIHATGRTETTVISGRPALEVTKLLAADPSPTVWGCHGWERRSATGDLARIDPGPEARMGLAEAIRAAERRLPGGRIEHKGAAVAVHFRGLDTATERTARTEVERDWETLVAERASLELRPFDGGLEVRAGARDKGSAVREILANAEADAPVAYLGDDLTDEDAFKVVDECGGLAILVRPEVRPTAAHIWVRPPEELLSLLDRWIGAVSPRTSIE